MRDLIAITARASAGRLTAEFGPNLSAEIETALHGREPIPAAKQYLDPVSISGLIVSIATLAWTVYNDLRQKTLNPSPDVMRRTIRIELRNRAQDFRDAAQRDHVIDIVVSETFNAANARETSADK